MDHAPIYNRVRDFINLTKLPDNQAFESLALAVFSHQFGANKTYRRYCERLGRSPANVRHWREIPAVPIAAFKSFDLICQGPGNPAPELLFRSSGTTRGPDQRSRHGFPVAAVYETALRRSFLESVLPDGARPRLAFLAPAPSVRPESSLIHMFETLRGDLDPGAQFFIDRSGLRFDRLIGFFEEAAASDQPVAILGITSAFLDVASRLRETGRRIRLPSGSRIVDTGGLKKSGFQLSRDEIEDRYEQAFGLPRRRIVNEYGMAEAGSQFYDDRLQSPGPTAETKKLVPFWVRTRVIDPETGRDLPDGALGLLQTFDLANCGSVSAVITDDLAVSVGKGFRLQGRLEGAEPRGCALLLDELHEDAGRPAHND